MGTIGSGKDVVTNYLVDKYKFRFVSFGDMLREEFKNKNLKVTREGLISYQKEATKELGKDFWVKKIANKIKKSKAKNFAISGIRHPIDIEYLKREFGKNFYSIKVDASPKIRYERMKKRGREDAPRTYPQFVIQDKLEAKNFNLKKTFSFTDFTVKNNTTLDYVYEQVDKILTTIKHKK